MTIKTLIELLNQINPDSKIYLYCGDVCVEPQEIDGIFINPNSVIFETTIDDGYFLYFNSFDSEGQENSVLNKTKPFYLYRKE